MYLTEARLQFETALKILENISPEKFVVWENTWTASYFSEPLFSYSTKVIENIWIENVGILYI